MKAISVEHVLKRLRSTRSLDSVIPQGAGGEEGTTVGENLTRDASAEAETGVTSMMKE